MILKWGLVAEWFQEMNISFGLITVWFIYYNFCSDLGDDLEIQAAARRHDV